MEKAAHGSRPAVVILAALFALGLYGCSLLPGSDPEMNVSPAVVQTPDIDVEPADLGAPVHVAYLAPPSGEPMVDELLASPLLRDEAFNTALDDWIDYWQNSANRWFPDFVRRMGAFEQTVDSALAARRLPPSLRYLPLIESGYNPGARSHASAVGMWQFMAGTAREHGMEVGAFIDQRRDPFLSTAAAVNFLAEL
ncbi:MAG: transglycosylase SLT domain-containing protein, partial [Gemmatimonadetes bacterium]|nr:transglycosylase SLT domain-containing protein [Gemmatimonadota bacterium]